MFKTHPFKNIKMPIIALTGGIASGKTTVSREFKELGALIIDTDKLSRTICKKKSPVLYSLVRKFGSQILTRSKTLNRKKLARIIFEDRKKRKALEYLVHPAIMKEAVKQIKSASRDRVVILDAPLLFETGLDRFVSKTIVVCAPEHIQAARLKKRDGLSGKDVSMRLSSQMPLSIKKSKADFVIDNSKGLSLTMRQIKRIWGVLTKEIK